MTNKMNAIVATAPGEYGVESVDRPEPGRGEVLCLVKSVAICGSDPGLFSGKYNEIGWPPRYPFIYGHEWSGEVIQPGPEVNNFITGDRVAGEAHCGCGYCTNCKEGKYALCLNYSVPGTGHRHYGFTTQGAYAEYVVVSARSIEKIPEGVSFDEATMCDTGGVALQSVRIAQITACQTIVVYGPGPIGNLVMQIAKARGAGTIMVGRRHRLELAAVCGADYTVNYERSDPVAEVMNITGGIGADAAIECAGTADAVYNSINSVKKDGRVSLVSLTKTNDVILPVSAIVRNQIHVSGSRANPNCSIEVMQMIQKSMINTSHLITHKFRLTDFKEALELFSSRRDGAMKVVINP